MNIDYYVFSGTGNTLLVAGHIADKITKGGNKVTFHAITDTVDAGADSIIGVAFPVAFFSTYPLVLNFFERLPMGNGRKIFITATMAGAGMGLEKWFYKFLLGKGYAPIAADLFVMPSNYNNKIINIAANKDTINKALVKADLFAATLMTWISEWKGGNTIIPTLWHKFVKSGRALSLFYRLYPIQVFNDKCVCCMRCVDNCPVGACVLKDGFPVIESSKCQCCQRCVGFCPVSAIGVAGKQRKPYSAVSYEEYEEFKQLSGI